MSGQEDRPRLLVVLPSHGHGGCEYGALSFARFARDTLGWTVAVALPDVAETAFLRHLIDGNGLDRHILDAAFDADDDEPRVAAQEAAMHRLLAETAPDRVFVAMPWPARAAGVVLACAAAKVATAVKFALVPETLYAPTAAIFARLRPVAARQAWFANSRYSAALLERHMALPAGSVAHFPVAPIGLTHLVAKDADGGSLPAPTARERLRAAFGFAPEAVVAATVGRLASQKGYETLLQAAEQAADRCPGLVFLWIGEGELRPQLEAAIGAAGLGGRIVLAGFRTDVRALLRGADIFAFPTVYEGGTSQALLEAMEEGLAVVASRAGTIAETIGQDVEGRLVDVGDAAGLAGELVALAGDPALRRRLGAAAKRAAAGFSAERMFRETLGQLDEAARRMAAAPRGPRRGLLAGLIDKIRSIAASGR